MAPKVALKRGEDDSGRNDIDAAGYDRSVGAPHDGVGIYAEYM
jgi:hypothetical protein